MPFDLSPAMIGQDSARLRAGPGSARDRLANVERIVTDGSHALTHQIEALRSEGRAQ